MIESKNEYRKLIAPFSVIAIICFASGMGFASLVYQNSTQNFVENFMGIPFNQGLTTGMAITLTELERSNQCSDLNIEDFSPEFIATFRTEHLKHGEDSLSCWLIDTGEMWAEDKSQYDCEIYNQELEKARKLLMSLNSS